MLERRLPTNQTTLSERDGAERRVPQSAKEAMVQSGKMIKTVMVDQDGRDGPLEGTGNVTTVESLCVQMGVFVK